MRSFFKRYNEKVRIEKTLNQTSAERITDLNRGRPLMVGPAIDEKVRMTLFQNVDILVTELHQNHKCFTQ